MEMTGQIFGPSHCQSASSLKAVELFIDMGADINMTSSVSNDAIDL